MSMTPSWLCDLLAVLMLSIAAYCSALLVIALVRRRASGADVEVSHVVMGISMAGMFVTSWQFGGSAVWQLIFGASLVWFVVRSIQSIQIFGVHLPHGAIHAVMSAAMLLMYWFPSGRRAGATLSGGSGVDPGLALLLAAVLLASAVFSLASPYKGASFHGTHLRAYAMAGSDQAPRPGARPCPTTGVEGLLGAPRLEDASHSLMCVAVGFLLVLTT